MEPADISDYALIGNSRAAALVSIYGSIDWCCLPEFDSPPIFAALLDPSVGGYFSIHPVETHGVTQKYLADTNVVQTIFTPATSQASLTDGFVAMSEGDKQQVLHPGHELLRIVEGISGTVTMRMEFIPRLYYGRAPAHLRNNGKLGISFTWKGRHWLALYMLLLFCRQACSSSILFIPGWRGPIRDRRPCGCSSRPDLWHSIMGREHPR